MKITTLIENTCPNDTLAAEHGLSLYIETARYRILFDMGQSPAFAANARLLGIDLAQADLAILSHGHYDHGGGLGTFLELNSTAPVYLSQYAFEPYYHGTEKYIGLDLSLKGNERFIFTGDMEEIAPGLTLHTCNDRARFRARAGSGLTTKKNGKFLADDFRHEQYLLIEENGKRVLISGCSHKGILDIMEWFRPDVLVGGFHFYQLPLDASLAQYARELDAFHTDFYTCHCTGTAQYEFMKPSMRRLHYLATGQEITI